MYVQEVNFLMLLRRDALRRRGWKRRRLGLTRNSTITLIKKHLCNVGITSKSIKLRF